MALPLRKRTFKKKKSSDAQLLCRVAQELRVTKGKNKSKSLFLTLRPSPAHFCAGLGRKNDINEACASLRGVGWSPTTTGAPQQKKILYDGPNISSTTDLSCLIKLSGVLRN
jgi:hypothetical protein